MTLPVVRDFTVAKEYPLSSNVGFQSTEIQRAIDVLSKMRSDNACTKFIAFTGNIVATGLRGVIAQCIRENLVDCVITSGGAIDHDIIRCYKPYYIASFAENDASLHARGVNRIGNVLVPNSHYVFFEKKVQPVFKKMYAQGARIVSPTQLVNALADSLPSSGAGAQHSFLRAARKRGIPVYSPALVDSAIGLQLFFFKQDHPDFGVDATADFSSLAALSLSSKRTGALILGGGSSKHFTLGLNLLRGGLDYSVYVSTADEFDGSLSGAPPREATSWGKIRTKARTAFVHAEATLALPTLISGVL